jgi:hypothetical protein
MIRRMADRDEAILANGRREFRGLAEELVPRLECAAERLEYNGAVRRHSESVIRAAAVS